MFPLKKNNLVKLHGLYSSCFCIYFLFTIAYTLRRIQKLNTHTTMTTFMTAFYLLL